MIEQNITLNLESRGKVSVFQRKLSQRRSLWRRWRQLSRLQKNLFLLLVVSLILITYYSFISDPPKFFVFTNNDRLTNELNEKENNNNDLKIDGDNLNEKNPEILFNELKEERIDKKKNKNYLENSVIDSINVRQRAVINATRHAWNGYKKHAWGHDHLRPISHRFQDWFHLGLTIVDSLDTLFLMNLTTEFSEAREWVENSFSLDHYTDDVNLFEVTIRVLGGLLSAYHFSGDGLFLEKAADLGERLLPCFLKSPTAIPFSDINLASRIAHVPRWSPDSSTAEVTTLQLEFRDLSRCTRDSKFEETAFAVSEHVHNLEKPDGLVPIFINPNTGNFNKDSEIKLGARGDSYYEYLLKQWLQTGKTINFLKYDYIEAIDGIMRRLVKITPRRKLTFIGELKARSHVFSPKMDHLTCYLPGTLALGVYNGMPKKHLILAEQLMETCYRMYADQPTHLTPEIVYFNYEEESTGPDMYVQQQDTHNLLRPEFVESLWAMYQITGNETYQTWGWEIFQAIEKFSKVAGGYTSIGNVLDPNDTRPKDLMESFFLSETLKYLYLLFSSNRRLLDMKKYVMNSEGHPLPIYKS